MTKAVRRDIIEVFRRQFNRYGRQSVWVHVECRKNAARQLERLLSDLPLAAARVDPAAGSGFLNDQPSAVDDARYCIVNHLAEKETSVEVSGALAVLEE